jgi:hypothetical protein
MNRTLQLMAVCTSLGACACSSDGDGGTPPPNTPDTLVTGVVDCFGQSTVLR